MPRFVQLPADYKAEFDDADGLDGLRAVVAGLFINTVGAALAIFIWFLWGAA